MAAGLHVAVKVGMVLLTAVTLVPVTVARADCFSDIVNGFVNTLSAAGSDACASACADSAGSGCAAAAAVAASLGAAAAGGGQGTVGSFCSNINNANNDLASIQSYLGVLGDSAGSILDALQQTGIADPLNVIQCGCSLEQGIDQLGSAASSCIQGLLCDLQNAAFPGTCGCTPTPPTAANCTPSDACSSYTNPQTYNQDCANTIAGNYGPGYYPVVKTTEPGGTLITSMQDPHCGGGLYCFCPSPMQVVYKDDLFQDGGNINNGFFTVYCECPRNPNNPNDPENTHPAQKREGCGTRKNHLQ